ncbi:uncharacterized protein LOC129947228 [Eupeodes corollae]|uniref:uncharacterized protein LOC129947228 n=1 Tax=Eupeodes corollae TaxID=290404 RepID=UPI00249003D4|nr:uncharacterized protein LOC129947228 [Eupeodes corollae]
MLSTAGVASPAIPTFGQFQVQCPESFTFSTPLEWPKWRRRFERFMRASGLSGKTDEEQVNTFIYIMGSQAEDILLSFGLTDGDSKKFLLVMEKFDNYFVIRRNVIYERAMFNSRKQEEGEPVDTFITSLYALAEHCNFGALHDELIRDRIVVGVRDHKLSEKLQMDNALTLEKAVQHARQSEAVKRQLRDLAGDSQGKAVDFVASTSKSSYDRHQKQVPVTVNVKIFVHGDVGGAQKTVKQVIAEPDNNAANFLGAVSANVTFNDAKNRSKRWSAEVAVNEFYTPGKDLIAADALSRQPLHVKDSENKLEEEIFAHVNLVIAHIPASDLKIEEIWTEQQRDLTLSKIASYTLNGWPEKNKLPNILQPYFAVRDEIANENGLLMRGCRLIIPASMRQDILGRLHAGHQGITKCRARARESVWWPGLSTDIAEMINRCSVCIQETKGVREKLMPSDFPTRPWQKVAMDLFKCQRRCPHFPQSNGFIEAAVKIAKLQLKKNADPYKALLEYRASPLSNGYSPAELLMGRRIRSTLPMVPKRYESKAVDYNDLKRKEDDRIEKQTLNFNNRHRAVQKHDLIPGEFVWVRDKRVWATVREKTKHPRSYIIETPTGKLRRNSFHLTRAHRAGEIIDETENDIPDITTPMKLPSASSPEKTSSPITSTQFSTPSSSPSQSSVPSYASASSTQSPLSSASIPSSSGPTSRSTDNQGYLTRYGRLVKPVDRYQY